MASSGAMRQPLCGERYRVKVVPMQAFRMGFQALDEPVKVERFGQEVGIYLPLNEGKITLKAAKPRLVAIGENGQPIKRGPGRPRKTPVAAAATVGVHRTNGRVTEIVAPKRGRGRPRKNPLPEVHQGGSLVPVHEIDRTATSA